MNALGAADLRLLLEGARPLAEELGPDQVQPNGLDISLDLIWRLQGAGRLGRDERTLPGREPLDFAPDGWIALSPGSYLVRFAESLRLPRDIMALGRPRSTLARCGVALVLAVWDAGYEGRSEALLVVHNADGFRLQRGARLAQLVFFRLATATESYQGHYQGENLSEAQ